MQDLSTGRRIGLGHERGGMCYLDDRMSLIGFVTCQLDPALLWHWRLGHPFVQKLRPEDLRKPFGQFGQLKDIYLPRDYYTGEPRGFGFIQYVDPADAAEAKYQMDGEILLGRELTVVFAEENRKKPVDMRARERGRGRHERRSPRRARYSRSRSPRYSRSPRRRSCSGSRRKHSSSPSPKKHGYSPSPRQRGYSRSASPDDGRVHRERSYSHSPVVNRLRSRSPYEDEQRERSRSLSR